MCRTGMDVIWTGVNEVGWDRIRHHQSCLRSEPNLSINARKVIFVNRRAMTLDIGPPTADPGPCIPSPPTSTSTSTFVCTCTPSLPNPFLFPFHCTITIAITIHNRHSRSRPLPRMTLAQLHITHPITPRRPRRGIVGGGGGGPVGDFVGGTDKGGGKRETGAGRGEFWFTDCF